MSWVSSLWAANPSAVRRMALGTASLWLLLTVIWWLDITSRGLGTGVAKAVACLAFAAAGILVLVAIRYLLGEKRRSWGLWLLLLLVLGFVLGFMGLEHEVGQGYYTDEGHYLHRAQLVNSGQIFHRSMIYPHLLYYRDGLSLWLAELFPTTVTFLAEAVYGVDSAPAIPWLVLRWATALLGVTTLIPVFLLARRIAGLPAAVVAGLLIIFSTHYHDGFHVNICDVPSAAFAAWTFYIVGLLLEKETLPRYLWAGVTAALAAASKYPAGMVATAIVGVWLVQRWRHRSWHWGLLAAGGISLATFLAFNPSLLVYPQATLMGERGLFFGVRQYSQGGWIGVMPSSNGAYYWQQLRYNFGWAIFPLAVVGCFGLTPDVRRRLMALSVFPLVFVWLICSMNMVVVRNLFPLIPPLAVYLGIGAAGVLPLARRLLAPRRAWGVALAAILLVLLPTAWRTTRQAVAMTRPSTRQLMSEWMQQNVPRGASLLKESYTPNFRKVWFPHHELRFLIRFPPEALTDSQTDFAVLASQAHGRFFRAEHQTEMQADWYRQFFASHDKVHEVHPGPLRLGPQLMIYRLRQDLEIPTQTQRPATEAFLPNPAMRSGPEVVYQRQGQFALFKVPRPTGAENIEVLGAEIGGHVVVRDMANQEVARVDLDAATAVVDLPTTDKYFFYVYLRPGSRLRGVRWFSQEAHGTEPGDVVDNQTEN